MRWDKRKMKYIEENSLGAEKMVRNEAGVLISKKQHDKNKATHYQSWVQKTKQRIPKAGTVEHDAAEKCD